MAIGAQKDHVLIKVHLRNGETLSFDLHIPKEADRWGERSSDMNFQKEITGIGIIFNSHWYTLPFPKKFRNVFFEAELVENTKKNKDDNKFVGERIKCFADNVLICLMVYYGKRPKMSRVDLIHCGKRRFNPDMRI